MAMTMAMAGAPEANSQAQTINLIFYGSDQTINLAITPALAAANNFARDSFNITHHLHRIYAFIIPVFIGLLQIQSQGNTSSPFKVHPVSTTAGVLFILGYYLAFLASFRMSLYSTQLSVAMGVFGSLSLATLVTLLLPESWWHIRYIFNILLAVVELHPAIKVLYDKYLRRFIISWPSYSQRRILPLSYMDSR